MYKFYHFYHNYSFLQNMHKNKKRDRHEFVCVPVRYVIKINVSKIIWVKLRVKLPFIIKASDSLDFI